MHRITRSHGFAALAVALLAGLVHAQPADSDPFADGNAAPKVDKTADLVRFEVHVEPKEARPGQIVRLTIRGTPKAGFHTYPLTQRSEDTAQDASGLSEMSYGPSPALAPLWPVTESAPAVVVEKAGGVFLEFNQPFTWAQDVLVLPDAGTGEQKLGITIKLQVCDEHRCVRGQQHLEATVRVAGAPVPLTAALEQRLHEAAPPLKVVSVPAELRDKMSPVGSAPDAAAPAKSSAAPAGRAANRAEAVGLLRQMGLAALQGFVMLLTPCVFPMIPITVSFFLKQGEKEHHSPIVLASVYSGTIFLLLSFAVLVLGHFIVEWANNVWLNLGMGIVLLFFALSLFGMFEIELPHFLTRFTSSHEGQGGYIGAFFMALTFTINSFTCTGPFLGPLLSGIKESKLSFWELSLNAAAYAAGFAAPFFLLALFPRLLKSLPKSGGWLNSTKVVMGFLEVALALKFLSITDAGLSVGYPRFFNYETVLCAWMALSVACGLYLLGVYRLPHDGPLQSVGVPRLMLATFFLGLAVYMTPLLSRRTPLGAVGEFLVAWLPNDSAPTGADPSGVAGGKNKGHLDFTRDYDKAWAQAKSEGKLLFVDFTGVNCQNCRYNEGNVFPREDVRAELAKFVRVQLYTDIVPDRTLSNEQSKEQAQRNFTWQDETFNDTALPLYVVLDVSRTTSPLTADGKLAGRVKGQASGTITDVPEFVAMLRDAQGKDIVRSR